jgi:hypothetical protein
LRLPSGSPALPVPNGAIVAALVTGNAGPADGASRLSRHSLGRNLSPKDCRLFDKNDAPQRAIHLQHFCSRFISLVQRFPPLKMPSSTPYRLLAIPHTGASMSSFKYPDLQTRQSSAAAARKAMLERFRAAAEDPAVAEREAARIAVNHARLARMAEREAAKKAREAELAAQAARAAELALQAEREAEEARARLAAEEAERKVALEAEQKAARDARYAARKAAKKERRRGY